MLDYARCLWVAFNAVTEFEQQYQLISCLAFHRVLWPRCDVICQSSGVVLLQTMWLDFDSRWGQEVVCYVSIETNENHLLVIFKILENLQTNLIKLIMTVFKQQLLLLYKKLRLIHEALQTSCILVSYRSDVIYCFTKQCWFNKFMFEMLQS